MLFGFIGRVSPANSLKEALDASSQRSRAIANRVAGATLSSQTGFALPAPVRAGGAQVDLEHEMVSLADEQLHYDASAKLLQKVYEQIHLGTRDR